MDHQVPCPFFLSYLDFFLNGRCRYIYVPLGGKNNIFLNIVLIFSFVALWHDLTFRLLAWGWLVALFIVPEILATLLLPENKV